MEKVQNVRTKSAFTPKNYLKKKKKEKKCTRSIVPILEQNLLSFASWVINNVPRASQFS